MDINLITTGQATIAEIVSDRVIVFNTQDMLDIMADCSYQGANHIIIHEKNLVPEFFDLKTRIAGDILQKFSNYNVKLAVIGDFSKYSSKSLRDFIYESNKAGRINFTDSLDDAVSRLTKRS